MLEHNLRDPTYAAHSYPPTARYFFARDAGIEWDEPEGMPVVRLRVWALTSDRSATPFGPLILRAAIAHLDGALQVALREPSTSVFAIAARAGALREALSVLASLYNLDGLALWHYDETTRELRSLVTYSMGNSSLAVPLSELRAKRRGIVSQILPDGKIVLYDAHDRELWRPAFSGKWDPYDAALFRSQEWRSCIVIPVVSAGRVLGALSAYSKRSAKALLSLDHRLTHHGAVFSDAILIRREQRMLASLEDRYDEELLTANVSLSALSLIHDIMHYFRSTRTSVEQVQAYLDTGQWRQAQKELLKVETTMVRTEPAISAMRRLATEARRADSRTGPQVTSNIEALLAELESLLRAILPQYSNQRRLHPGNIDVVRKGTPRPIAMQPMNLERCIVNLCVNAAQWNATNVWVTMRFDRSDSDAHIVVRDNGRGISPAARDRVFDRFYSGRNGSGLGLYVVRSLAKRAGGEVYLQSWDHTAAVEHLEHRGTVVTVVVPTTD